MNYKELYLHLMRRCEEARQQMEEAERIIIEAQRWCEEQYLDQEDEHPALTLVFPGGQREQ